MANEFNAERFLRHVFKAYCDRTEDLEMKHRDVVKVLLELDVSIKGLQDMYLMKKAVHKKAPVGGSCSYLATAWPSQRRASPL